MLRAAAASPPVGARTSSIADLRREREEVLRETVVDLARDAGALLGDGATELGAGRSPARRRRAGRRRRTVAGSRSGGTYRSTAAARGRSGGRRRRTSVSAEREPTVQVAPVRGSGGRTRSTATSEGREQPVGEDDVSSSAPRPRCRLEPRSSPTNRRRARSPTGADATSAIAATSARRRRRASGDERRESRSARRRRDMRPIAPPRLGPCRACRPGGRRDRERERPEPVARKPPREGGPCPRPRRGSASRSGSPRTTRRPRRRCRGRCARWQRVAVEPAVDANAPCRGESTHDEDELARRATSDTYRRHALATSPNRQEPFCR